MGYALMKISRGEKPSAPNISSGSPERFGYSWGIFNEILPIHKEQFIRWTAPLPREFWWGKNFLDVGCGIGRNSYWPLRWGASSGLAIDVDERSLAAARKNLSSFPNVRVEHRSAYQIEESNRFDIVYSIGVVHHLERPELAVNQMVEAAVPGGVVLLWLYGKENNEWILRWFAPLRRILFGRAPLWVVFQLARILSAGLWLGLRLGLSHIQYLRFIRRFSFRHLHAVVFDQMIPRIAKHYTRKEAVDLLKSCGLTNVEAVWVNEMSWAVIGTKT
jgi:SAM-dependent methyltransferase